MKNLKQYEIDAIVNIIVEQITPQLQHKISPKKLKQMEVDSEEVKLLDKQIDDLTNKQRKIYDKYKNDSEVSCYNSSPQIFIPQKVELDWNERLKIKDEIIISSIANKDIEKLINQLVKKYSK